MTQKTTNRTIVTSITLLTILIGGTSITPAIAELGDQDDDGVLDATDNCINVPNPIQSDIDRDGIGNLCDNNNNYTSEEDCNGADPTIWWNGESSSWKTFDGTAIITISGPDGTKSEDVIDGSPFADTIYGGNGTDYVCGLDGNDKIDGGNGNDVLFGNNGADSLYGRNGDDLLFGNEGKDSLLGGNGNDFLDGGPDSDVVNGGIGIDTCKGELRSSTCEK